MKTLSHLLTAILVIATVYACSSPSGPDTPSGVQYPFTEQTWQVNSGEDAEWVGMSGKQKRVGFFVADSSDSTSADTTFINQPHQYGLEITDYNSSDENRYVLTFYDSTYNTQNPTPYLYVDSLFNSELITINNRFFDTHVKTSLHYHFDCSTNPAPVDTLEILYAPYQAPEDTVDYYRVNISGALDAVEHIKCNS